MDGSPIKTEKSADHRKSGYKSWKKKYRKMRIVFDQKMQQGEDLHKKEEKATATVKRLAVENEYVYNPPFYLLQKCPFSNGQLFLVIHLYLPVNHHTKHASETTAPS